MLARGSCLDVPIFVDNEECLGLKLGRDQNNRTVAIDGVLCCIGYNVDK